MIEIFDKSRQLIPIKAWVDKGSSIDETSMMQALNLSNLTSAFDHVVLMPDVHAGYGMPIGGVIALDQQIIPNCVGVDIGCGISFVETNIHASNLSSAMLLRLRNQLMRRIPTGADHRKNPFPSAFLKAFADQETSAPDELIKEVRKAPYQLGTLGGGNHFIEIQSNLNGHLCLMVHSGSRHFGHAIATYFHRKAKNEIKQLMTKELAHFDTDSSSGKEYIRWMTAAMAFAKTNRGLMMTIVVESLGELFKNVESEFSIDIHHNYALEEMIEDKPYWVHRKGAISAHEGEYGIIPGSMGGCSYLTVGKGNPESFYSCSHGAGRRISRKEAINTYDVNETRRMLESQGVLLGTRPNAIITDEDPRAYKDIDWVLNQEQDLVEIKDRLKPLMVIKG